jgi:hypothetical protein
MRLLQSTLLCLALLLASRPTLAAAIEQPVRVELGRSVAPLYGPWKFHVGDDPRWASVDFDDSAWESMDLTPKPGANDGDVGYTDYVPGWNGRGHRGYSGYAWYRMHVSVAAPPGAKLALSDALSVDSAHQTFFNGRLLGGSGEFRAHATTVFSLQPREFALPEHVSDGVVAIRVWVGPATMAGAPDAGGVHIAPAIGEAGAIHDRYLLQQRQLFLGYVVEVVPGALLILAAVMAASVSAVDRSEPAYRWMAVAALSVALLRLHLVVFNWMQVENAETYGLVRSVLLAPLSLGSWIMAWLTWFRIDRPRWIAPAAAVVAAAYAVSELLSGSWLLTVAPNGVTATLKTVCTGLHLGIVVLYLLIAVLGARREGVRSWLVLLGMAVVAVYLFGPEISLLHINQIWFPYGVGVSLREYSSTALAPVLFFLLLGRLIGFTRELEGRRPAAA